MQLDYERNEEMKETIAKIIQDGVCSGDSSWDEITLEILKAMREPTEKMLDDNDPNDIYERSYIKGVWHIMIDSILNDR